MISDVAGVFSHRRRPPEPETDYGNNLKYGLKNSQFN